ncbi:hypothetical protein APUTEX25_001854 [Auxenochlorella protothecoides]|uniref:Major facilitator superfamily (MFS) profile domain-containing protein n=1 Tax=Auxenochlorella protothecoides TaxID=3075 RepID=A0A3M7L6D3_AUXPR|nr:hypothetical protein APUTEX25_001854 [Auxenochlorella protothecoides]|eukprot:RMZ57654.1 hypothetical protein APUTEX25_001854 [Auxenochlorella protothecoides]
MTWTLLYSGFLGSLLHIIGGYDSGITGGVFSSTTFLEKFYPELLTTTTSPTVTPYCKYANDTLNLYTALFYPGVLVGAIASSFTSRWYGRLSSLRCCAVLTIVAAVVQVTAPNRAAILAGRVLLGFGDGFNEHVSAIYLAEIAPAQLRGKFISGTIFFGGFGVFVAQVINYGVRDLGNNWQWALGLVMVPAGILLAGSLFMPESPSALNSLGRREDALRALRRLRGREDVGAELDDISWAAGRAPTLRAAWHAVLTQRRYVPPLVIVLLGVTFNWWSGNSAATFYAPNVFTILGFGHSTALINAVVIGCSKIAGVLMGMLLLDRFKRRSVLFWGCGVMIAAQVTSAILFNQFLADVPGAVATNAQGIGILVTMVVYELAFMGTQNTTVTVFMGEFPPLEIRPVVWVLITLLTATWGTVSTYTFLLMLCAMKWGLYLFSAGVAGLLLLYTIFLVPETSHVPVERLQAVFYTHWLWKRFMPVGDEERGPLAPGDPAADGHRRREGQRRRQQVGVRRGVASIHGRASYTILFAIVFAETGLVIAPFLPGDSLLFATGALAASDKLNIYLLLLTYMAAAVLGDLVSYTAGKYLGAHVQQSRLVKKEHLVKTQHFFAKHGGRAVVLGRFLPIVRTFAPFVAGMSAMPGSAFAYFNVLGAALWTCLCCGGGYVFGNVPLVRNNFSLVMLAIVVLSILPAAYEVLTTRGVRQRKLRLAGPGTLTGQFGVLAICPDAERAQTCTPEEIQEVSARELEDAVQSRAKPLIIDFYATWCGPCVLQSKELVKVAERLGDSVRILKIDTDENPDISNQLQIMGLPTVIIVPTDTSKPALRTEGLLSADKIVSLVTSENGPAAVTTFDAGAKGLY